MHSYSKRLLIICSLICVLTWDNTVAQLLPSSHYKYKVILSVCKKIAAAKGDVRKMPELEVISKSKQQNRIAQLKWQPVPKIIVDEQLYDLCKNFAKDSLHALACIIGHELAHYYENHSYTSSFSNPMASAADSIFSQANSKEMEGEADYFGLFYGFLAGYDTFRVLPHILDSIYKAYNKPEQLPGYPTKDERISIARKIIQEVKPLVGIFQAGQFLYLRKNYQEAAVCFDYLLTKYPGREIYNNSGVAKLALAMEVMDAEQLYFAYPFELDADTRLTRRTIRSTDDKLIRQQKIDSLLSKAQRDFEKTIAIDQSYSSAYINLASVYSLQNNQEAAIGKINELEKVCISNNLNMPGNAYLLKGIAKVKMGQIETAQEDFEKAHNLNAHLEEYNLALYKKLTTSWHDKLGNWLAYWPEVESWIHTFWLDKKKNTKVTPAKKSTEPIKLNLPLDRGTSILISDEQTPVKIISIEISDNNHSIIQLNDYSLTVFSTSPNYNGRTSAGITIGASLPEMLKRYGEPSFIASAGNGHQYYGFEGARIIFEIKAEGVIGWNSYSIDF